MIEKYIQSPSTLRNTYEFTIKKNVFQGKSTLIQKRIIN